MCRWFNSAQGHTTEPQLTLGFLIFQKGLFFTREWAFLDYWGQTGDRLEKTNIQVLEKRLFSRQNIYLAIFSLCTDMNNPLANCVPAGYFVFLLKRSSSFFDASLSVDSREWPYMSIVVDILEWPRRLLMVFG